MINEIKIKLLKEWKYTYPSYASVVFMIISEFLYILMIYYTAKAFVPNVSIGLKSEIDYFTFVMGAEVALRLPSLFLTSSLRTIKLARIEHCLHFYLLSIPSFCIHLFKSGLLKLIMELPRALISITFILYLKPNFSIYWPLIIGIISIIPFFFVGLIPAGLYLATGRGESITGQIISASTILSGAYFPTAVLPLWVKDFLYNVSPLNALINALRSETEFKTLIVILIWIISSIFFMRSMIIRYKRTGAIDYNYV